MSSIPELPTVYASLHSDAVAIVLLGLLTAVRVRWAERELTVTYAADG